MSNARQKIAIIGAGIIGLTSAIKLQEAGYEVTLVSTEGGKIEMDGYSNPTDSSGYSAHEGVRRRCRRHDPQP